jgi:hypothetical protein
MKTYSGRRIGGQVEVLVDGNPLPLGLDLFTHSPTGFEYGYTGSGSAQLALAILRDYLKDDTLALNLYQKFKFDVIASLHEDSFEFTSSIIDSWLHGQILKLKFDKLKEKIDNLKN